MDEMGSEVIEQWLHQNHVVRINYPNTARIIVEWIESGMPAIDRVFTEHAWESVSVIQDNI